MRKVGIRIGIALMVLLLAACQTHYAVTSVSKERLVVDSRYEPASDHRGVVMLSAYTRQVDSVMSPVVGETARYLERGRPEGPLSNLLPDIFIWAGTLYDEKPDFAVYNYGGIRAALPEGKITKGDINSVAPFENKIVFFSLKGDKVLELFQQMLNHGGECVSHEVRLRATKDGRLLSATINGEPVDTARCYRVTTIDYLQQGNDNLTAFKSATDLHDEGNEAANSRNVILRYVEAMTAQGKKIDAEIEGRIVYTTE